jgi:CDP-glycerol glycerophosphotransferase (TagB/SpsB family)
MSRRARKLIKILVRPGLLCVWLLSGLSRRDPRRWVFGSWYGRRFADNSKWLFLHVARERASEVNAVWIGSDRGILRELRAAGLPAHHGWSPRGIAAALRAGVCVFDVYTNDLNYWFTRGAKLVNLWHGIPLKRIERDIENAEHFIRKGTSGTALQRLAFRFGFPWIANRFDLMPASSDSVAKRLAGAFGLPISSVPVTGFPRNDAILAPPATIEFWDAACHERLTLRRQVGKRIVAYIPTFRDRDSWGAGRDLPLDWVALDAFCGERDLIFALKLHGNDRVRLPDLAVYPNLLALPDATDLYPLLGLFDLLVTDYSSIYFDFLLLDRPMIFFNYDQRDYVAHSRGFYGDYDAMTPGPKAPDFATLLAELDRALEDSVPDPRRAATLAEIHRHPDADSSRRVCDEILRRFASPERDA